VSTPALDLSAHFLLQTGEHLVQQAEGRDDLLVQVCTVVSHTSYQHSKTTKKSGVHTSWLVWISRTNTTVMITAYADHGSIMLCACCVSLLYGTHVQVNTLICCMALPDYTIL